MPKPKTKTSGTLNTNTSKLHTLSMSSDESSTTDCITPIIAPKLSKNRASRSVKPKSYSQNTVNPLLNKIQHREKEHKPHTSLIYDRKGANLDNSRVLKDSKNFHTFGEEEAQDKSKLRVKLKKLQKAVKDQDSELKEMYSRVSEEGHDMKNLAKQFLDTKKRDSQVKELKSKLSTMQLNETKLLTELKDQRKATEELLEKLYGLQNDSAREVEYYKQYYKDYYSSNLGNEVDQYKQQLNTFELEKDYLMSTVRKLEKDREQELTRRSNIERDLYDARTQVEKAGRDNDDLREELRGLKHHMKEKEKSHHKENDTLKVCIEQLRKENAILKEKGEEWEKKDLHEKVNLKKKLRELEEEVAKRERILVDNEVSYRDKLGRMEKKINQLEEEHESLADYQQKLEELRKHINAKDREFENKENHYNQKLEMAKRVQEQRKREWSGMYNELLREVKDLKSGMSSLEREKFLTSEDSRRFEHYT